MRKVSTATLLIVGALLVYAATMTLLVLFGDDLQKGGSAPDTSAIEDAPIRAANLLAAADQVVGMLFTITVGLLIGVGFIFRDRDFRVGLTNATQMSFVIVLMLSTICAVYFGYTARMHALLVANYSLTQYTVINHFIGRQALSVVVAAGAALGLFAVYLTEKHAAPTSPPSTPAAARKPRRS